MARASYPRAPRCWIAYGIAISDPLVVAPNLVTLPSSLLVLSRLRRSKR